MARQRLVTTRALDVRITAWSLSWPGLKVPAGAAVMSVGGNFALCTPKLYGASDHDARHYYFWVPADAVAPAPKETPRGHFVATHGQPERCATCGAPFMSHSNGQCPAEES